MLTETATSSTAEQLPTRLPLTESQRGLLVVDGWVPTPQIYNQLMQVDLDPALTTDTVVAALAVLVAVQPALRQVFAPLPDAHASLTPPPSPQDLPLDRVVVPAGEFATAAAALAEQLGQRPFDLHAAPAYRFGYVRAADDSAAAFILCAHHIVSDGVSMGPLVRDLENALTGGIPADSVPALVAARETAFARELRAQNRTATSERTVDNAKAWAEHLRDVPPLVLSPRPNRPRETDFAGARVSWRLDERETALLSQACKRLAVTPFVLLTGLYGAVLARHGGVSSVLVGSPFTARRTIGAFDLCGFFVNTLPVRVDVDWDRTVDEFLGGVVRTAVDYAKSRADVTFNQLVALLRQDRTSNRNPLFSCMLAMQDTFDGAATSAVLGVSEPGNHTAKFDLWLGATPERGGWLLELEYDRELIAPTVADGLLGSLRTAVRRALADGSATVADLFADASFTASLRTDGHSARVPSATLVDWLRATAAATPDARAIDEPGRTLSYAELVASAEELARYLVGQGVAPHDVVGLAEDTLCDTTIAMFGILWCGATFLPLDPSLPADRLAYMVDKADCRVVVGDGVDLPGVRLLGIDKEPDAARGAPPGGMAESAPYLMFTSGSSGLPKGVLMGHGPLLNLTAWQIAALGHDSDTRFLQYAPLGFDVSFQEIMPTLAAGGTVVARGSVDRRDFPALVRRVADAEITHIYLPVAALRPFVQAAQRIGARFPALRHVCVSGEQLLVDDEVRAFFVEHPHCDLVNLYGPTETHAVTTHRLTGADQQWPSHVPIGLPMHGVAGYVVDRTGHLAPVGVPGDLHLGGLCPAEGYLNDPERTTAAFLPDRFAGDGRVYRTGDLVVRDEHGVLIFLGRDDTQVKIRGYRVELGEIDAVANTVPGVRQAVAVATGAAGDRELVLFLLNDIAVDHEEVRARLTAALPSYMVPVRIFDIDSIPTSGTGKTDHSALAALADRLAAERAGAATGEVQYRDDLERALAELWQEVLDVEGIEPDRSLLEYGAHSLNVFAAFAVIEEQHGVSVPVADFFRAPTVVALADLVRELREDEVVA
ncbi:amino acid adenylation domain-containing protein [Solihabitans fulvus]|uniref:Amino acid adenylation domain-containing protein n=2 Tax=Solihabitans fulvus TaxID=1892852 RepID=A0A5B2WV08_9PSEU|nr:non-ribosomal peptide synthetase [Solihabitans fulvus]KAA2255385.1 amino acid adenylation domain-containing protein [Solihabitans fulvus]